MKTCLIRQPAGLGDILYCYKIAKLLLEKNRVDEIIWPVIDQYNFLGKYLTDFKIYFLNERCKFPFKNYYESNIIHITERDDILYIPLQHADRALPYNSNTCNHPMYVKYEMCNNLDFTDWYQYLNINRNYKREKKLIDKLNININEPFNVVNLNFGSPPNSVKCPEPKLTNNYPVIYLDYINDYNIFDWLSILEAATEVHTVETSLCYLLRYLRLTNVFIYPKQKQPVNNHSFKYIRKIYDDKWNFITSTL